MEYPNLEKGNCQNFKPEADLFNPDKGAWRDGKEAIAVCLGGCAVREICLEYAIETHQDGIWGGTTEYERRSLRRKGRVA